jgi:hypothetical protein
VIIKQVNWRTGLFRLWLSAAALWWLAVTTGVVTDAGRDALVALRQSQGVACDPASSLFSLADASACEADATGAPSAPGLSMREVLPMTLAELQADGRWSRWPYLFLVPLVVLATARVGRCWAVWVRRGFAPEAPGEPPARGAGPDRLASDPADAAGIEDLSKADRVGSVSDRERAFRASIVRATQTLNGLDSELAELEPRMAGATEGLGKTLRVEIPALGRKLIELVKTLDKEGLAPGDPLFSDKVKPIRP